MSRNNGTATRSVALIECEECGKQVSDKAAACPNCGAPVIAALEEPDVLQAPTEVTISGDTFVGTKPLLTNLAVKSIHALNWKVDRVDEVAGLVSFTTGMTWGSFSGVSGSIYLEEIEPFKFTVSGNAKQNLKGGQFVALNIGNEAQKKVKKVLEQMRRCADSPDAKEDWLLQ